MDLGSLFLIIALIILVALFISRPFWESRRAAKLGAVEIPGQPQERSFLLAERDRILNALQELDFDYAMGKIPEEDYPAQRLILVTTGADVLRRLDALESEPAQAAQTGDAEARLEAAVMARREGQLVAAVAGPQSGRRGRTSVPDDPLEREIAARRRERQEKAAGFCPQCGNPVQKSDLFCPKCGTRI
jgi:hypothetical protein